MYIFICVIRSQSLYSKSHEKLGFQSVSLIKYGCNRFLIVHEVKGKTRLFLPCSIKRKIVRFKTTMSIKIMLRLNYLNI